MTLQEMLKEIENIKKELRTYPGLIRSVELTDALLELYDSYVKASNAQEKKAA